MYEQGVIFLASKLHVVIVVSALLISLFDTDKERMRLATLLALALPVAYVLGRLAGAVYYTERPFVELGIVPLVSHMADNGFPSEHTLYALTIAGAVFVIHKRWGVTLIILALLVGLGRILASVHNPVDVVGSIVIAFVTLCIAVFILHRWRLYVS